MNLANIFSRKIILITIFLGVVFFLAFLSYFAFKFENLPQENAVVIPEQEGIIYGLPARLKIPVIGVDASVESLGLVSNGDMDVPKGPDNVAWFNLGTIPGENGSAVVAGHFGTWKNGKGSVFDELHTLKVGDKIFVEDEKGKSIVFAVREIRNFDPKEDATEVFSSDDEKVHLNLITCEGAWNKDSRSYAERLVVFADKE